MHVHVVLFQDWYVDIISNGPTIRSMMNAVIHIDQIIHVVFLLPTRMINIIQVDRVECFYCVDLERRKSQLIAGVEEKWRGIRRWCRHEIKFITRNEDLVVGKESIYFFWYLVTPRFSGGFLRNFKRIA